MQALSQAGINVTAYTSAVGPLHIDRSYNHLDMSVIESNPVRCPDPEMATRMEELITEVRKSGDTVGGVVTCILPGPPAGLGQPAFDKLNVPPGAPLLSTTDA